MFLSVGACDIKCLEMQDSAQMYALLDKCTVGSEVIGEARDDGHALLVYITDSASEGMFGLGLLLTRTSSEPHFAVCDVSHILIGFNNECALFDCSQMCVKERYSIEGRFVDFIHLPERERIIAIHTNGAACYHSSGQELWSSGGQRLTGYELEDKYLYLYHAEAAVRINIKNGSSIPLKRKD